MTLTSVNSQIMGNSTQMSELPIIFEHCVTPKELHQLHQHHRTLRCLDRVVVCKAMGS